MPRNVHISTLEYDISTLGLSDYTKVLLDRYYFFLYRDNKICIPYCVSFSPEFNYLFKFNGEDRQNVVKDACDLTGVMPKKDAIYLLLTFPINPGYSSKNHWYLCTAV